MPILGMNYMYSKSNVFKDVELMFSLVYQKSNKTEEHYHNHKYNKNSMFYSKKNL